MMVRRYKRIISVLCILVFVSLMIGRSTVMAASIFQIDLNSLKGKLVIIHTNDTHGFLLKDSERSLTAASVVSLKKIFEAAGAEVLLLDSGDTLFGTPMFNKDLGPETAKLLNEIGYDAMTAGNHDFDYGGEKLLQLVQDLKVPLLVANVMNSDTNQAAFTPYLITEKGKFDVGIFGITTDNENAGFEKYGNASLKITNPVKAAKEVSKELKKEGADLIIALGHIGMDARAELSSVDVISEVPDIDLFIDAHSHSTIKLKMIHEDGSETLLVRNLHYFSELGVVVVDEDKYMRAYTITKSEMDAFIESSSAGTEKE